MAQLQEKYQSAYTGADLDAAIARSKNVTATDTELNYSSGVTSPIQTQIDGKSAVSVSATGTATDEVQYITVDGVEKKIGGGAEYTAGVGINITNNVISNTLKVGYEDDIDYPTKGDKITVEGRSYRVLADNGDHKYLLLDVTPLVSEAAWHSVESNDYFGSTIDTYLNQTYYATLSATLQAGIQDTSINQYSYTNDQDRYLDPVTHASTLGYATKTIKATNNRKIFALDPDEIETYFNNKFSVQNLIDLFEVPSGGMYIVAFRNAAVDTSSNQQIGFASLDPTQLMSAYINGITSAYAPYGVFHYFASMVVDLSVVPFVPETSKNAGRGVRLIDENGTVLDVTSKQDKLTAGENITISEDNTISATDTKYTAGTNVQINNNVISATDTTYSAGSKITITDNTIATSANEVSVSATGSATDEVQYITIDGVEKKLAGGGAGGRVDYEEVINWPSKGDKVTIEERAYRVMADKGNHKYLLADMNYVSTGLWNTAVSNDYFGSTLDTYLNTTYYAALSDTLKAGIQETSINQYTYTCSEEYITETHPSMFDYATKATKATNTRKIYALDVDDIETYFNSSYVATDLPALFEVTSGYGAVALRSAAVDAETAAYVGYMYLIGGSGASGSALGALPAAYMSEQPFGYYPAMIIDLSVVPFTLEDTNASVGKRVNLLDENGNVLDVINKQNKISNIVLTASTTSISGTLTTAQIDTLLADAHNFIRLTYTDENSSIHVIEMHRDANFSNSSEPYYNGLWFSGMTGSKIKVLLNVNLYTSTYGQWYLQFAPGALYSNGRSGIEISDNLIGTTISKEISITGTSGTISDLQFRQNEFNTLLHDGQRLWKLSQKGNNVWPMIYGSLVATATGAVYKTVTIADINGGWTLATGTLQNKLTAGTNITIDENNVISATGGSEYTAGTGIDITDNVISNTLKVDYEEIIDPDKFPLTLTALTAGSTVSIYTMGSPGWTGSYSTDRKTWQAYVPGTTGTITLANEGDKIYFKGVQTSGFDGDNFVNFTLTGSIAASGNFMSFVCGDNYLTATALPYAGSGRRTFRECAALKTVSANFLPATTLTNMGYQYMFHSCTNLTTPPALPATVLADNCYNGMFYNCPKLVYAPAIVGTGIINTTDFFYFMFRGCTSLIVSDESGTGYEHAWRFPAEGTFVTDGVQRTQSFVFYDCPAGHSRGTDSLAITTGSSFTYYTQNEPIVFTASNTNDTKNVKLLDEEGAEINVVSKQDVLTAETDITVKTMTGGVTYLTEAPTADNPNGLKIVVLNAEPATKYNGYLYLITEE